MRSGIGAAALALVLAGAAQADPSSEVEELYRREPPGRPPPRAQLFISPSGEPFRAAPGQPYPSAAWFAQADSDRDGRLTRDEFRADAEAWFKVVDRDGDGKLDMNEAGRWEEELVPEMSADPMGSGIRRRGPPGRNQLDTRRQGAAAYSLVNEPHPIRGADADFSMSVSVREWRVATDRRFAVLDIDGDGVVLAVDLGMTPAQLGDRRPPKPPKGVRKPPGG
jgi:Ca2+-binding EF-hand superfamily protein